MKRNPLPSITKILDQSDFQMTRPGHAGIKPQTSLQINAFPSKGHTAA